MYQRNLEPYNSIKYEYEGDYYNLISRSSRLFSTLQNQHLKYINGLELYGYEKGQTICNSICFIGTIVCFDGYFNPYVPFPNIFNRKIITYGGIR
jgi:hypothetical protein